MTERISYVPVRNARGETILRPHLALTFTYRKHTHSGIALVDSGADVNVLPYRFGIELGAVWDEQTTAIELSGNLANYEARGIIITATVGQLEPVRLAFAWTKAENVPLILGQVNFFMEFDVCFFRSQNVFEVRPK